jgi:hypothetical protein
MHSGAPDSNGSSLGQLLIRDLVGGIQRIYGGWDPTDI